MNELSNRYTLNTVTITRCMVRPAYTAVHSRSDNTNRQNHDEVCASGSPSHLQNKNAPTLASESVHRQQEWKERAHRHL